MAKVFISGPMTGIEDWNRPAFMEAEYLLRMEGHIVMNPAVLPLGFTWKDYMEISLQMLSACDAVYMLEGWEDSAGARLERRYAIKRGMKVWENEGMLRPDYMTQFEVELW